MRVKERNIYMFMFRDGKRILRHPNRCCRSGSALTRPALQGTLITIHESKDSINDDAIKDRLKEHNTVLRETAGMPVRFPASRHSTTYTTFLRGIRPGAKFVGPE